MGCHFADFYSWTTSCQATGLDKDFVEFLTRTSALISQIQMLVITMVDIFVLFAYKKQQIRIIQILQFGFPYFHTIRQTP